MDDDAAASPSAAARAVREALGGGRPSRRQPSPAAPPPPPPPPAFHFAPAAMGPAPFVSSRQQQQLARSGPRSPPRHTAVTISDDAAPLRFRAPPLSIDTSPGPHRNHPPPTAPIQTSVISEPAHGSPQGRRRMPSSNSAAKPLAGAARGHATGRSLSPPPPATGVLSSSLFVRRKPAQRPPSPSHEPGLPQQTSSAPHVLFFQDADSDLASQPRDASDEGSQRSTADSDPDAKPAPGSPSSHFPQQLAGVEKLGELSRDEEAYDFAILLKPTKVEEHLDVPAADTKFSRTGSNVHSVATSANAAADDAEFKLPGTPRAQLKRQRHDPASARAQLVERITRTGLEVKRLLSLDGRQTLLKVRAPAHVLELGAERMRLRKRRQFDEIWMEFACELRETFLDFDAARGCVRFLDSEKQSIVHALLTSDERAGGAGLNELCALKARLVLKMFPLHKHDDLVALRAQWVTYWRDTGTDGATRLVTRALAQPVDAIAQYYGERIAYYFAWSEMYTRWLVVPSAAGVVLFVLQVRAKTLDHPLAAGYAIFMALWTAAFLLAWRRRAAALAYKWGTLAYEEEERARPEFDASCPAWKRYARYAATVPLVVASIALVLLLTFAAFRTRDRLEAQSIAVKAEATHLAKDIARDLQHGLTLANWRRLTALGMDWDFWFYFLLTPLLYGLLIPVLDYAFTRAARRLTSWENHATESRYQSHLILKVFSFRFVHVFASLYYYAFNSTGSLLRVAVQLASFMVSDQLWRNVMQTLYPFVRRRLHARSKKHATNAQFHQSTVFNNTNAPSRRGSRARARHGSQLTSNALIHEQCVRLEQASDHAWEEAELEPYDTFEDYTEMLIQFGYVTFFSLAFPLAPLLALLNNVVELRVDAFKLCHAKQRPLAQKASGIGVWLHVLQLMSVLAVLTNCLHMAFTTTLVERLAPRASASTKVWVVFAVEHAILALQVGMVLVVPATPSDVQKRVRSEREHAKLESARAMAAKIQAQQLLLQQQPPDHEQDKETPETLETTTVRRRTSRGASHEDDGLRAAQAVLEDA